MANSLAGLLTGIDRGGIDPNASSEAQQMQLGAQASQMMQQGMRGLTGQSRLSKGQQLQQAMGQLDPNDPEDARKLIMLMQATGDYAGAAKLASNLQNMKKEATAYLHSLNPYDKDKKIPNFAPELFRRAQLKDPLKMKEEIFNQIVGDFIQ